MNLTRATTTLNPDPRFFESLVFRMHQDLKFDENDPLLADFVLIHSPAKLLLLITAIVLLIKAAEHWMQGRDEFTFARPAFLVNCGLTFGINGCGVLIALAVTEGGNNLFQCIDRSHLSLSTIFCRYVLFVYLATLVYDLLSLILPVLQKQQISNVLIMRQLVWIAVAFVIIKNHPVGYPVFVPMVHSFLKVMNNMLTVMETASQELKPDSKWSHRLEYLSLALHIAMIGHQVYFHSHSPCCPTWVPSVTAAAAVIQTLSMVGSMGRADDGHQFSSLILG